MFLDTALGAAWGCVACRAQDSPLQARILEVRRGGRSWVLRCSAFTSCTEWLGLRTVKR